MFSVINNIKQNLIFYIDSLTLSHLNLAFVSGNPPDFHHRGISYICGNRPSGNVSYSRTIEAIYFCEDCNGKLIRVYNNETHSLTEQGNYYKCIKCEKVHTPILIKNNKNNEVLK